MRLITPLRDDAGRRERRQRAGQRAVARHDRHQQGGTPARPATAIAGGASSALAGVAPAPIVARTKPITKNMIGSDARVPAAEAHGTRS